MDDKEKGIHTLLHEAVEEGCTERVRELVKFEEDVDRRDEDGYTPLLCAAANGHTEIAKILLDCKADVMCDNWDGDTPLHLAASANHTELVKVLLAAGGCASSRNDEENTPLHEAAARGYDEIVRILVGAGSDVDALDERGNSPLMYASLFANLGCVEVLLLHGATPVSPKNPSPSFLTQDFGGTTEPCADKLEDLRRFDPVTRRNINLTLKRAAAERTWRRRGWLELLRARSGSQEMTGSHHIYRIARSRGVDKENNGAKKRRLIYRRPRPSDIAGVDEVDLGLASLVGRLMELACGNFGLYRAIVLFT